MEIVVWTQYPYARTQLGAAVCDVATRRAPLTHTGALSTNQLIGRGRCRLATAELRSPSVDLDDALSERFYFLIHYFLRKKRLVSEEIEMLPAQSIDGIINFRQPVVHAFR
ncbi:unnamed protein product [Leptosia nina]|uniref:Uncharacterized protein n=1 Tax=Leptosia nina TaxID=320188 RepID=A0AAV1JVJ6_9NEOP